MQILVNLDLGGNEIRNVILQVLASDPDPIANGQIYYNSTLHAPRLRANGAWITLGAGGASAWSELTGRPAHLTGTPNAANQVPVLDAEGKLLDSTIPDLAISQFLGEAANQSAMLALQGQKGDYCVRTDTGTIFIITGPDPTDIDDWLQLTYPTPTWATLSGKPSTFPPRKHTATIGDGSATQITVTHNFDTKAVIVSVRENSGDEAEVLCDIERTSFDAVRLTFATAPASNALAVTIIG